MNQSNIRALHGKLGEDTVAQYLQAHGFLIVARNFTRSHGEADLIAQKGDLLIFVEVKLRQSDAIDLAELVPYSKQKKIISVAKAFLSMHTKDDCTVRFDVALVDYKHNNCSVRYIEDAFAALD